MKSVAVKSTTAKTAEATVEPAGHVAAMESATSEATTAMKAASSEASPTVETATAAPVAAAASATRQGHGWRSQANGRDCQ